MKKLRRRLRHENAMSSVPTYEVKYAGMEDARQRTLQQICNYGEAELNASMSRSPTGSGIPITSKAAKVRARCICLAVRTCQHGLTAGKCFRFA